MRAKRKDQGRGSRPYTCIRILTSNILFPQHACIAAQSLAVANAMLLVTKLKHEEQEKLVNAAELHFRLCETQRNLAALRHRNLVLFEGCSSSTSDDHQDDDEHQMDDGKSCSRSVHCSFLGTDVRQDLDLLIQREMMEVAAMTDSTSCPS